MLGKIILMCAVAASLGSIQETNHILEKGPNFTVRRFVNKPVITQKVEGTSYKFTEEYPTNQTVPEEGWDGNFGDVEFIVYENGDFLTRDTIINNLYNETIVIHYARTFSGMNATGVNVFNFGRERGLTYQASLGHVDGIIESYILVPPNKQVRMFLEAYGVPATEP